MGQKRGNSNNNKTASKSYPVWRRRQSMQARLPLASRRQKYRQSQADRQTDKRGKRAYAGQTGIAILRLLLCSEPLCRAGGEAASKAISADYTSDRQNNINNKT